LKNVIKSLEKISLFDVQNIENNIYQIVYYLVCLPRFMRRQTDEWIQDDSLTSVICHKTQRRKRRRLVCLWKSKAIWHDAESTPTTNKGQKSSVYSFEMAIESENLPAALVLETYKPWNG